MQDAPSFDGRGRIPPHMGRAIFGIVLAGGISLAIYGFWQGVPERDIADAVHRGDRAGAQKLLAWDRTLARAKVYPHGYEPWGAERGIRTVVWRGRYLIHDTVGLGGDPAMLELLASAGADLAVRLEGRTLLHEAARDGNVAAAVWLLDHGAELDVGNDCGDNCADRGRTPLHDATAFGQRAAMELLLARGAAHDAVSANGQTALHVASVAGSVDNAWVLCRYGADTAVKDAQGRTPQDLADAHPIVRDGARPETYGPDALADWLRPGGGCDTLAARARTSGAPVGEDDARVLFGEFLCARGVKDACAPAK